MKKTLLIVEDNLILCDILEKGMASVYWNGASPKGYISLLW